MSLTVQKNIRALFKKRGIKISSSAFSAIDREIEKLCLKAADKVLADNLKVVKESHIPEIDALLESSSRDQL